jgi:hypothetical protein
MYKIVVLAAGHALQLTDSVGFVSVHIAMIGSYATPRGTTFSGSIFSG